MKTIKVFLGVALFGAVSFGAYSVLESSNYKMDALLENIEALTEEEYTDDEIRILCLRDPGSVCVLGRIIVTDCKYSPH